MPESEPKPKLIELVAPGAGQGWKAVLKNGKQAVVHEISAPAAEAAAAVPRIQRLAEHRHPSLAPVLAWGTDPNGLWVAVEPNEGTPLGTILSRGPLTPPAAAALGAAVLSGVAALHEAGIAMGGFGAAAIRVTGNGEVRISGHPAAAVRGAPSQSDLRADVRSCGMAICAAFGVDPAGAPAPPTIPPGLVVTMRSMASGAMGPAADRAQGALREMASALLAPDRMTAAQSELALRAGGREMPSITPYLPKDTYPPAPAPRPTAPQQTQAPQPWGAPVPAPSQPQTSQTWGPQAATPAPSEETQAPATYTPPPPDEPVRPSVSYDPPARPTETYPPLPGPPEPPPYVPPARSEPAPSEPAPYEPPPRAAETFPPVAPPPAAAPVPTWDAKPAAPAAQPGEDTWDTVPTPPSAATPPAPATPAAPVAPKASPSSTWDTFPPAPARSEPGASAPAAVPTPPPPAPEPPPEPRPTWTAIPTPVWTPSADVAAPGAPAPPAPAPPPAPAAPSYVAPAAPSYVAPSPSATTSTSAPAPLTAPGPTPARKPPAPRRPTRDERSERPPWLVPAAIAIVVLLLLGTVGVIVLASRGGGSNNNIATTSPKTSPKASPKASASPSAVVGLQPVPKYAPSSNPPVTSVEFLPDATCTLTSCRVDVEMKYSPAQGGELGYTLKFFDRCTGTTTDLPGRHFTPPVAFIRADPGFQNVTLPSAKSAALVAVSTTPAVAASAPMLLGADSCS